MSKTHQACQSCNCRLSRFNTTYLCSPCTINKISSDYLAGTYTLYASSTAAMLDIKNFAEEIGRSPKEALSVAFSQQLLPSYIEKEIDILIALLDLSTLSNSAAAKVLNVSRFKVANLRTLLGLANPYSAHGSLAAAL